MPQGDQSLDSSDEHDDTKLTAKKPRRKAGTSKQDVEQKRVKGVRGKLKMLTEIPLDVLFEVSASTVGAVAAACFTCLPRYLVIFTLGMCCVWHELPSLFVIFSCAVLQFQFGKALFQTLPECPNVQRAIGVGSLV